MRNHSSTVCFRYALLGRSGPWLVTWLLLSDLFLSHLHRRLEVLGCINRTGHFGKDPKRSKMQPT